MHKTPRIRLCAIAFGLLLAAHAGAADEFHPLLKAKQFAEAESAANAKLVKEPDHADAMVGRTHALLGLADGRTDEAIKQAERCVTVHPNNGRCHLVLGKAMGTRAMENGIMASLGSAGTIRDAFNKAVALNPRDFDARFSMLEYYMMAPFVVGGGMGKAEAFAEESAGIHPEGSKLMHATIDRQEGRLGKAEAAALAVKPGTDEDLQERHDGLLTSIAATHMSEKRYADAIRVLSEARKRYPDSLNVGYVSARVQQEQGDHRKALAGLEQVVIKLPRPHVHYHIGKSAQALGDKARATAAFQKALSFKRGLSKNLQADAEAQLKALKG